MRYGRQFGAHSRFLAPSYRRMYGKIVARCIRWNVAVSTAKRYSLHTTSSNDKMETARILHNLKLNSGCIFDFKLLLPVPVRGLICIHTENCIPPANKYTTIVFESRYHPAEATALWSELIIVPTYFVPSKPRRPMWISVVMGGSSIIPVARIHIRFFSVVPSDFHGISG
jgi:hypothetical protein